MPWRPRRLEIKAPISANHEIKPSAAAVSCRSHRKSRGPYYNFAIRIQFARRSREIIASRGRLFLARLSKAAAAEGREAMAPPSHQINNQGQLTMKSWHRNLEVAMYLQRNSPSNRSCAACGNAGARPSAAHGGVLRIEHHGNNLTASWPRPMKARSPVRRAHVITEIFTLMPAAAHR